MTSMMLKENRLTNIACGCGYDYELFYKINYGEHMYV